MRDWLDAHKPAASARTHLLLAALMWSVVGTVLLAFGLRWVWQTDHGLRVLLIAAAMAVGLAKAHFVLRRAAARIADRVRSRGDNRCIGGFFSVRTWLFVGLMAAAGQWTRTGPVPHLLVGLLYVAVGTALVSASRHLWQARVR